MTDIKLRPYQQAFIDAVRNEFHNSRRVVGVAPCGSGKTIMTGWMTKQACERGKRTIFFVHRKELIRQTSETFSRLDIPHGIISAGVNMQLDLPVQIASIQTLARRLDDIPAPDFLICDECHHILANTYKRVIEAFPNAYLLGVTATPERMGGITLCDSFDSMVESFSVDELIKLGNLTPFKYFAPSVGVDLHKVRTKFGEYVNSDIEKVMSGKKIIGGIVEHYQKLAAGKSAICYCVNVKHSVTVAKAFRDAGINAAHCDGETPAIIRDKIVDDFRNGKVDVLCNAELFGEGFDVPNMQAVILARPTRSLTLYIQQAMRSMRPDPNDPNKVAVIIDHVQNYLRHGLPNTPHEWSLAPNPPKRPLALTKECPQCHAIISLAERVCPLCGFEFIQDDSTPDTNEYSGNLVEVEVHSSSDISTDTPKIKKAFTKPEEFFSVAKEKNYKIGWVAIQSLAYANSYEDCLHIAEVCNYNSGWAWHKWQELQQKKSSYDVAKRSLFG